MHDSILAGDFDAALATWDGYSAAVTRVTKQQRALDTIKEYNKRAKKHYEVS